MKLRWIVIGGKGHLHLVDGLFLFLSGKICWLGSINFSPLCPFFVHTCGARSQRKIFCLETILSFQLPPIWSVTFQTPQVLSWWPPGCGWNKCFRAAGFLKLSVRSIFWITGLSCSVKSASWGGFGVKFHRVPPDSANKQNRYDGLKKSGYICISPK